MRTRLAVAVTAGWLVACAAAGSALADGVDVSWPQCGVALPAAPEFAIVGVNGGRPFDVDNPCLAAQVAWAGPHAGFYANTANRGPSSAFWPSGQAAPKLCLAGADSLECAEDYGWNAAADSYARAVAAQVTAGLAAPGATRTAVPAEWWLDVESANTWRDPASNVAVLRGAVGYLVSVGVARVGFYANPTDWATITGATTAFAAHASWVAGLDGRDVAVGRCGGPGFTGGGVALAQYDAGILAGAVRLDGNVRCPVAVAVRGPASVVAGRVSGAIAVSLGVVQGGPTAARISSSQASPSSLVAPSPIGPFARSTTVAIPSGARTVRVYFRSRRAGVAGVRSVTGVGAGAYRIVVRPARAARVVRVTGYRTLRAGGRVLLRAVAFDAFGNRASAGLRWTVSSRRVASIRVLSGGRALVRGLAPGVTRVRVVAGRSVRTVSVTVRR